MLKFLQREQSAHGALDAMLYDGWHFEAAASAVPTTLSDGRVIMLPVKADKLKALIPDDAVKSPDEAVRLFNALSQEFALKILYSTVSKGKNIGKVKTLNIRKTDEQAVALIEKRLEFNHIDHIVKHSCYLRTEDNKVVLMFSPEASEIDEIKEVDTTGLNVVITDYNPYGGMTSAVIVWLPQDSKN